MDRYYLVFEGPLLFLGSHLGGGLSHVPKSLGAMLDGGAIEGDEKLPRYLIGSRFSGGTGTRV